MKTIVALAALVCAVMGEAPLPKKAPSDNPRGVYFVLPPAPQLKQHVTPDQVEEIMSQLRGEDGSDSGLYHIVLPDGRLQRVEYTTAPIKQEPVAAATHESESPAQLPAAGPASILAHPSAAYKSSKQEAAPQPAGPAALLAQSPRPVQAQPQRQQQYPEIRLAKVDANGKLRVVGSFPAQEDNKAPYKQEEAFGPAPAKYVASVQYTEVQPIQGPIYSYNNQPLTRVVRYAPVFY